MFRTYRKASVIVSIVFCLFSSAFAYSGGSGDSNSPYQIATVSDWQTLMNTTADWDKHFIMISDVKRRASVLLEA